MCHVLIIEDEPFVAIDLERILGSCCGATSFDFAVTEDEAVASAQARRPDLITSDVALIEGTGPRAVARILDACGTVPVIFVTATPDACEPCEEPAVVLMKPVRTTDITTAFTTLRPA